MTRSGTRRTKETNQASRPGWAKLTWDDLSAWAGSRSVERGRSYQRSGRVADLAITADGKLLAWVRGSERYATWVELLPEGQGPDRLHSRCSCPVGFNGCKHAVAVVLDYLQALRQQTAVPEAEASDPRWELIPDDAKRAEAEDWDDDGDDSDEEEEEETSARPRRHGASGRLGETAVGRGDDLRAFLEGKSADELVEMLLHPP